MYAILILKRFSYLKKIEIKNGAITTPPPTTTTLTVPWSGLRRTHKKSSFIPFPFQVTEMLKTGLGHLQCYRHPRLLQVFDRKKRLRHSKKKEQNGTYMGPLMEKKTSCKSEVKAPLFGWRRGRLLYLLYFRCWLWLGLEAGRVGGERGGTIYYPPGKQN